ncbi:hypothetical protein J6A31_04515 [bacterium]|nr:hypothetical protein [bacterium]
MNNSNTAHNNQLRRFCAEPDSLLKGRYVVTLAITIYREMLGKYPDFLSEFETPNAIRDGYTTRFIYICTKPDGTDAIDMSEADAKALADEYENKFSSVIDKCESTGDWSQSPFDFSKLDLIFNK